MSRAFDANAYVRKWVADPELALRELAPPAPPERHALAVLDAHSASSRNLRKLNESLLPMVQVLGEDSRRGNLWTWFTGADVLRDATLAHVAANVESVAEECQREAVVLQAQTEALRKEITLLEHDARKLTVRVDLGRLVLTSPEHAPAFAQAAGAGLLDRFRRKHANLESLLVAQQLTRAQYELALGNGKAMLDRFEEIRSLLLPLWYQRMGFELFSRRLESTP